MKNWHVALTVGAIALVAIGGLALPSTASAHARLKSSTPAVGEVLQTSPSEVVVIFTEDVQKVSGTYDITVEKDRGPSVTSGPAILDDNDRSKLSVPLQPDLPAGRYVVNYKNVSDSDGDPFNGAFSFYIQTQPTAVDRANDAQLAQIGAEEETPGASETAGTPAPGETGTAAVTPGAGAVTAVATASGSSTTTNSGGSDTGRNIAIAAAIVVALALVAGGAWYAFGRPRR